MTSDIKRSEFKKLQTRIDKLKYKKTQLEREHPELQKIVTKLDPIKDSMSKLNAMNSLIGFLVRKGLDSALPMEILIDIANDYEKKLNDK